MNKKPPKEDFVFDGFEPANTTPVPDVLFDVLLSELTGTELKILLYIIRRTWGFKKDADAISLSQFQKGITTKDGKVLDRGSGISDRKTVLTTLASLESKGCIQIVRNKTASGDNATSVYRINFKGVVGKTNHLNQGVVGKTNQGSGKNQPGVVGKTNPQETVIQQTDSQETVIESIANEVSAIEPIAPDVALSPASHSSLSSFPQEEEQSPIVTVTTRNDQSVEQQSLMPDLPQKPSSKKKERHTEPLTPKKVPEMPGADMAWGTKKCLLMFDAWRGHTLIPKYKLMEASSCASGLAEQYTEEEVTQVYQAMNNDPYWQGRGGADIGNVSNNIHKEIKKAKTQKSAKSSTHGTASHDGYTKDERVALLRMSQEERKMYNQKRREAREAAQEAL